jgi:transcriptional regulator with GAF, ATPase, and Fis domain
LRCVALLDVDAAGVMLVDTTGAVCSVASSSEQMRLVELLEIQTDEGPCLDAYRQRRVIVSARGEEVEQRWPQIASHARDAGFEALAGVPMRLRLVQVGALNLFSRQPRCLSLEDQHVAQALADVATIGVLQARAIADRRVVGAQLQTALESRIAIEQAKGIVAEHFAVSVDDAFTLLRSHSRSQNAKLSETAGRVISGALRLDSLAARSRAADGSTLRLGDPAI